MKMVLVLAAASEAATGLALLMVPSLVGRLLLGAEISGVSIPLARVAGTALLALGVACWLGRGEAPGRATRGLVAAMWVYNVGAVIVLGAAGFQLQPVGVALWPAVVLHAAMAAWCFTCLRRSLPGKSIETTA